MRPGGFAQRAAKLKTCRICECRSAGENARFVELTDRLDALELDRAGREQVVLREHDLLRAAQQICLTRTGERSAGGQQAARDVLVAPKAQSRPIGAATMVMDENAQKKRTGSPLPREETSAKMMLSASARGA